MTDELGAHVSTDGGVELSPGRASEIGAATLQLFTKQPNWWREPKVSDEKAELFKAAVKVEEVRWTTSHDSYLINLASPDPVLWERSFDSFRAEVERSERLGLDAVVTHPGNATDGDLEAGLARNAEGIARALLGTPGRVRVLLELTAGAGTTVGSTFERLAGILEGIPTAQRVRVGVCFDTCHAYSAGYDLVGDYDGVWARFSDVIGIERLGLIHLNDSRHPFASRKDRHEHIGEGSLGDAPFRRLMTDEHLASVPKILETPKDDDAVAADRKNLARLRAFREAP
jgi:deoxyribonuclease-4